MFFVVIPVGVSEEVYYADTEDELVKLVVDMNLEEHEIKKIRIFEVVK